MKIEEIIKQPEGNWEQELQQELRQELEQESLFTLVISKMLDTPKSRAVIRNKERFPDEFMFQLTEEEYENLRSQIVTSSCGGRRYLSYDFTEQDIAIQFTCQKTEFYIFLTDSVKNFLTFLFK